MDAWPGVALKERPCALEAEAEWCALPMGSGEGEGPLALLGVTDLGIPCSVVMPAVFSLKETKAALMSTAERLLVRFEKKTTRPSRGEQQETSRIGYKRLSSVLPQYGEAVKQCSQLRKQSCPKAGGCNREFKHGRPTQSSNYAECWGNNFLCVEVKRLSSCHGATNAGANSAAIVFRPDWEWSDQELTAGGSDRRTD